MQLFLSDLLLDIHQPGVDARKAQLRKEGKAEEEIGQLPRSYFKDRSAFMLTSCTGILAQVHMCSCLDRD